MKHLYTALTILLGALVGAGGYFAASKLSEEPAAKPEPQAATAEEAAELRKAVADLQARMAKSEAEPGFREALNDPKLREELAAIVSETRSPGTFRPRISRPGSTTWRTGMARRCRLDYARLLEEARKVLKITDEQYKHVRPVFEKHFEPVEAYLRNLESGRFRAAPKLNQLVAPRLPATLADLKKGLPAEAYKAFDEWRKSPAAITRYGATQGDYFLAGEEYKEFQARRGATRNWAMLRHYLRKFYEKAPLTDAQKKKVEAALQAHMEKVYRWMRKQQNRSPMHPANQAKLRSITRETEAELAKVLRPGEMLKFKAWRKTTGMFASYYFGERYQPPRYRPPTTRPTRPTPPKRPGPGETF